jgi:hypothetical protein
MNYDDERTHRIYQTFLLICSVGFGSDALIGLTLLTLKPKWIDTILELLSA